MQYSHSEASLLPSGAATGPSPARPRSSGGVRLSPLSSSGNWSEEKQQQQASPNVVRLVDSHGRPLGVGGDVFAPPSSVSSLGRRLDARGLPRVSVLSNAGLRGTEGDMSALLRDRVTRTNTADIAALATAKHSVARNDNNTPGKPSSPSRRKQQQHMQQQQQPSHDAAPTVGGGHARSGSRGKGLSVSASADSLLFGAAPSPTNKDKKVKVTDFSTDGGLGAVRLSSLSMDAPLPEGARPPTTKHSTRATNVTFNFSGAGGERNISTANAAAAAASRGAQALYAGPPSLAPLADSVAASNASLQAQLRGLDLLSTAFGELIGEIGASKGHLACLLTRVKDNYKLLFGNLVDEIMTVKNAYTTSLHGCIADYKSLQLRMDGKVAHLEHRVRLLTQVSASKDGMIALNEEALRQVEDEMGALKEGVILGVKKAPLTVEQSTNAIIRAAVERDLERQRQMEKHGIIAEGGFGGIGEGASNPDAPHVSTFANGSAVDALTSLSLESRTLTFELSELIQNVALQSDKSAHALQHLDRLLDQGAGNIAQLHEDAALNVAIVGAGTALVSSASSAQTVTFPSSPQMPSPHFPATPSPTLGVEQLTMEVLLSPATVSSTAVQTPATGLLGSSPSTSTPASALGSPLATPVVPPSHTVLSTLSSPPLHGASASAMQYPDPLSAPSPPQGIGHAHLGGVRSVSSMPGASLHPFLSQRPPSAELRSSSRWQFLRHMNEEVRLEDKWSSATQTDETLTGYINVLHLEPVPLRAQLAAQLVEQRTPLKDMASSASTMLPEAIREQEEREEEKAKLEAGTATTDGAHTTGNSSTPVTAGNNATASSSRNNTFLTALPTSSSNGHSATAPSLPPLPLTQPLRPYPLRLNGFVLPASLRDFLAPALGLWDPQRGTVKQQDWQATNAALGTEPLEHEQLLVSAATAVLAQQQQQQQHSSHAPSPAQSHTGAGGSNLSSPVSRSAASHSGIRHLPPRPIDTASGGGGGVRSPMRSAGPLTAHSGGEPSPAASGSLRASLTGSGSESFGSIVMLQSSNSSSLAGEPVSAGLGTQRTGTGTGTATGTGTPGAVAIGDTISNGGGGNANDQARNRLSLRRTSMTDLNVPGTATGATGATPPLTPTNALPAYSRRTSLSNAALPLASSAAAAAAANADKATTLIGHDQSAKLVPTGPADPAAALSPLIWQPMLGGKKRASGIVGALDSSRRASLNASQAVGASSSSEAAAVTLSRPATPGLASPPQGPIGATATMATSVVATTPLAVRVPFKEPTTVEQLNPARFADESRFRVGPSASTVELEAAASAALAEFPPLSVKAVFDAIFSLYALHVANSSFAASSASGPGALSAPVVAVAATTAAAAQTSTGADNGITAGSSSLLADALLEYAVEVSGSVSAAPQWLGSFVTALLGLYARSELVRHFAHFVGLVHANNAAGVEGADFTAPESLDVYARLMLLLLRGKTVRGGGSAEAAAAHAPFNYVGDLAPLGPRVEDAFPPHTFVPARTAELVASELLSPLCVRTPGVHDVLARLQAWLRANVRAPPHPKLPPGRLVNHVPLAAFVLRAAREWRTYVVRTLQNAAKRAANNGATAAAVAGGSAAAVAAAAAAATLDLRGGADLTLDQWRLFLRHINAPVADALTTSRPHVLPALLRHFALANRANVSGDFAAVCSALIPLLRQAGFITIQAQHLMA